MKKHKIRHWSIFSMEWWKKKKWPKDGAWSIDWSDVLDSLKWSRAHLTCEGKMDTREEEKGCSLSGSWFRERCYPQLEGELWKNLLLLSLLMTILLAKVLPQIAFLSFVWVSVSVLQRHRTNGVIIIKKFAVQLFMPTCHLLAKFPACWREVSLCSSQAFDWSDETRLHYGWQSAFTQSPLI